VPVAAMSRSSALHIAAGVNDAAALDDVLRLPPMQQQTALCSRDSGKNTPLHIASYKGHLDFVLKMLSSCTLEHYALDLPNLLNDNGNTPLHLAVLGNNLHVIQALMSASPPSRLDVKDKQGYTPMHYACGEGYLDIVKARMQLANEPSSHSHALAPQSLYSLGATFDVTNAEGLTPLMCCSQQGHPDVVHFIVHNDPRCVFFCNAAGDTALHYAGARPRCPLAHSQARAQLTRPQASATQVCRVAKRSAGVCSSAGRCRGCTVAHSRWSRHQQEEPRACCFGPQPRAFFTSRV
jgi:ankyrin repeat protein